MFSHFNIFLISIFCFTLLHAQSKKPNDFANCRYKYDKTLKKKIYSTVEVEPEFPGGNAAMARFVFKNLLYPNIEEQNDLDSRKKIVFIVDVDGTLTNIRIANTSSDSLTVLEKELVAVIRKMPKWTPGRCEGKLVATLYKLPVTVCLRNELHE